MRRVKHPFMAAPFKAVVSRAGYRSKELRSPTGSRDGTRRTLSTGNGHNWTIFSKVLVRYAIFCYYSKRGMRNA